MVDVPLMADFAALENRVTALENSGGGGSNGGGWSPWINAADYGVSVASADNRAALQSAIDAAYVAGTRQVFLAAGAYRVSGPVDVSGVSLVGAGVLYAGLILTTPNTGLITIKGERGGNHCPGGMVSDLFLMIEHSMQGGYAIVLGTGGQHQPDRCRLERLRITTNTIPQGGSHGLWKRAINGSFTSRLSPPGIRGMTIRDVEIFNCTDPAVVLWGANAARLDSVMAYTGGGVQSMMGLWIGGTTAVQSTDVQVSDCKFDGPLNVTNTVYSGFEGRWAGGIQTDAVSQSNCVFSTD